jgi:Transposase DDE domain group 1
MQSSHAVRAVDVVFDDPNLIADAGLVPVVALAEQIGLPELVADRLAIEDAVNSAGANPAAKVMSLLAGMVAGADSIEDVDRLRQTGLRDAGMGLLFDEVRAPSTLGTFLRAFTHGHVQQLGAIHRQTLIRLAQRVPMLPGAEQVVFVDLDSTHRQVYGYAKQGAAVGRLKGKKTLHPLIATVSTPIARPVVVAVRLRKGKSADVRGAARFLAEALATVRVIAPTARVVIRADSKFYTADLVATAARYDAAVSLTTGSNPSVNAAITAIPPTAWTAIHYPDAFVDTETGELVSDAEVAEVPYTAFTSRPIKQQVTGRLIVRRVKQLNPQTAAGQDELFTTWRHHAVFVTSGFQLLQAESQHRGHAIVEQVIADAAASALAHLPSGSFQANAAWTVLWAIAHNLTRAAGTLAGAFHARATTATIRAHLINVPARVARSAHRVRLHLPMHWPWEPAWTALHAAVREPRRPQRRPA